ncbi:MAG: GNAT family N-acetyltransferase [Chloroflexi bacterium]|nr:GNAT family N-acetyltransferase [Chloroflexota bacterium]
MITIRPAHDEDLPHLPDIERAAATLFASIERFQDLLADAIPVEEHRAYLAAGRLWVAADADPSAGGRPVGFAAASVVDGGAHLDEVDVHPEYGRRGIGRALIEQVCDWAREAGYPAVTLTTERDIPWNAPYYARLGFEIVPEGEWSPGQRVIIAEEIAGGLDATTRVVMRRML